MRIYTLFLISIFALCGCSFQKIPSHEVTFRDPETITEKMVYHTTKPLAITLMHPATSPTIMSWMGVMRLRDQGAEFLHDIGGESVQIETFDGALVDGLYFDPDNFFQKQGSTFRKWKQRFKEPAYCKISEILEINLQANNLLELFGLPDNVTPLVNSKNEPYGVVCLPACCLIYELDPFFVLNFLARGFHVLTINYRGIVESKGVPCWKGTSMDAQFATQWLKRHLDCSFRNVTVCGRSFGTGPATYAGTQCTGTHVILDRGYARMSDVCDFTFSKTSKFFFSNFTKSLIEKFYRFPNEDWITHVQGNVLIIDALEDDYMAQQGERLYKALRKEKSFATPKDEATYRDLTWIRVTGGHYGKYWGDKHPAWYTDRKSQEKVTQFLKKRVLRT